MFASAKFQPTEASVRLVARATFVAGIAGMALSFLFLASAHQLDVLAGAAGFVAGAVLIAAGLVTIGVLGRLPAAVQEGTRARNALLAFATPAVINRWIDHFQRNRENRSEPDWSAPITLDAAVVRPLLRSLEQFQLGDGGGPASLIAWNAEKFRSASKGTRALHDLWFAEEREHARLLGAAVARFGGHCINGHWSFSAFCMTRKWFGVRFELTVLLLTEIVSTAYYRLIRRHGKDPALRAMCRLILRDEAGHVAFHRERLVQSGRAGLAGHGMLWEGCFRILGLAAASMLWINHAPGLRAIGGTRAEFYREVWVELSRFVRHVRRDALAEESVMADATGRIAGAFS